MTLPGPSYQAVPNFSASQGELELSTATDAYFSWLCWGSSPSCPTHDWCRWLQPFSVHIHDNEALTFHLTYDLDDLAERASEAAAELWWKSDASDAGTCRTEAVVARVMNQNPATAGTCRTWCSRWQSWTRTRLLQVPVELKQWLPESMTVINWSSGTCRTWCSDCLSRWQSWTRTRLLQVLVELDAVVARVGHNDLTVRGDGQPLRAVQGLRGRVDVRQEWPVSVKHLHTHTNGSTQRNDGRQDRLHAACTDICD